MRFFVISIIFYIALCHYKLYSAYLRPLHLDLSSFSIFHFFSLSRLFVRSFLRIQRLLYPFSRDFRSLFLCVFLLLMVLRCCCCCCCVFHKAHFSLSAVDFEFGVCSFLCDLCVFLFSCYRWQTTPIFSFSIVVYACISLGKIFADGLVSSKRCKTLFFFFSLCVFLLFVAAFFLGNVESNGERCVLCKSHSVACCFSFGCSFSSHFNFELRV